MVHATCWVSSVKNWDDPGGADFPPGMSFLLCFFFLFFLGGVPIFDFPSTSGIMNAKASIPDSRAETHRDEMTIPIQPCPHLQMDGVFTSINRLRPLVDIVDDRWLNDKYAKLLTGSKRNIAREPILFVHILGYLTMTLTYHSNTLMTATTVDEYGFALYQSNILLPNRCSNPIYIHHSPTQSRGTPNRHLMTKKKKSTPAHSSPLGM